LEVIRLSYDERRSDLDSTLNDGPPYDHLRAGNLNSRLEDSGQPLGFDRGLSRSLDGGKCGWL